MNIRIPLPIVQAWGWFGDRVNVVVWKHPYGHEDKMFEVLRIDLLIVILFMFCTGFYWAAYGWQGALQGGVMFIAIAALSLFVRRPA